MVEWQGLELPTFTGTLASVAAARRDALRDNLEDNLPPSPAPASASRMTPAPAGHFPDACAACGGHCCRKGGDTGYLDEPSLRLAWRNHPRLTRDELIAAYMNSVPDLAFAGSCIFHAAHGCNLSEALRSVICKAYLCGPLKDAALRPRDPRPPT